MVSHVTLIAGARPNFMKIAPLVRAFEAADLPWRLVHTGQHYDERMSQTFFDELEIPRPHRNLEVGSGSHVWQTTEVMRRLEEEFCEHRPAAVVVVGDVNSTLAAAMTANKMEIRVAHVEAGLRSFDRSMPEEINRVLTDGISDWLFTSEPSGSRNLEREGISGERVFLTGNVMIDTQRKFLERARERRNLEALDLRPRGYAVLTLHRPANVDDPQRLESILRGVHAIGREMPVVFPVHPRTRSRISEFGFAANSSLNGYLGVEPIGYLEMLGLIDSARLVLTDSGGLQEETTALRVPCLTIRESTERPITVEQGSNRLVHWQTDAIVAAAREALSGPQRLGTVPETWDGCAAERIAGHLKSLLETP